MTKKLTIKEAIIKENPTKEFTALVNLLADKTDFFTAPASANYHFNFAGGLALHTLNVIKHIKIELKNPHFKFLNKDSAIKCALLHDICKTGTYNKLPDGSYTSDISIEGHGDRSVAVAVKLGIDLTDSEKAMIEYHMGPFAPAKFTHHIELAKSKTKLRKRIEDIKKYESNYSTMVKKFPEILAIHTADFLAASEEETMTEANAKKEFEI